jgi:hypothetical protein
VGKILLVNVVHHVHGQKYCDVHLSLFWNIHFCNCHLKMWLVGSHVWFYLGADMVFKNGFVKTFKKAWMASNLPPHTCPWPKKYHFYKRAFAKRWFQLGDDNCSTSSLVDSIGGPKVGIEKCLTWITTKKIRCWHVGWLYWRQYFIIDTMHM